MLFVFPVFFILFYFLVLSHTGRGAPHLYAGTDAHHCTAHARHIEHIESAFPQQQLGPPVPECTMKAVFLRLAAQVWQGGHTHTCSCSERAVSESYARALECETVVLLLRFGWRRLEARHSGEF